MYCNSQGTDGQIEDVHLRYVYPWNDDPTPYLDELVEIGWMIRSQSGYLIPDWESKGQSTAAQMAEYREKNRLKQQRSRDRSKALKTASVTGDVSGYVGEERLKDRHGEASDTKVYWPVVEIPKNPDSTTPGGEVL